LKKFNLQSVRPLYQGFFTLNEYLVSHEKYDGSESAVLKREIFDRGDAAGLLAYDAIKNKVILVEQFRAGVCRESDSPWVTEIIAGIIEKDQSPEDVAIRESMEEAGAQIKHIEHICDFWPSPGGCNEQFFIYLGLVDSDQVQPFGGLDNEAEDIKVLTVDLSDIPNMLANGEIKSGGAIVALQWLLLNLEAKREGWIALQS